MAISSRSTGWRWKPEQWELQDNWNSFAEQCRAQFTQDGRPKNRILNVLPHDAVGTRLSITHGRLIFRESYEDLFKRAEAISQEEGDPSIVVTGQPGTGKSFWLWYVVMRLVNDGHPVVLANGPDIRLFFNDQVYRADIRNLTIYDFPVPPHANVRLWILIDWDLSNQNPDWHLVGPDAFAIQAASPNPSRYSRWLKQKTRGCLWGMPLWTHEELVEGLPLQPKYNGLIERIENALSRPSSHRSLTSEVLDLSTRVALEVIVTPTSDVASESALTRLSRKAIGRQLIEHAVANYGCAARDVYRAIFDPYMAGRLVKQSVAGLTVSHLESAITIDKSSEVIQELFQLTIHARGETQDLFIPDFKSPYIARLAMERQHIIDYSAARNLFSLCRGLSESSSFSGWIFETLAHKVLSGTQPVGTLKFYKMDAVSGSPTTFVSDCQQSPTDICFLQRKVRFFAANDGYFPDLGNTYYILSANNFPHIDSFLVEINSKDTVIWIFQCTISPVYTGSEKDNPLVQHIRKVVREASRRAARGSEPSTNRAKPLDKVKIRYALVCPRDLFYKEPRKWIMPSEGWKAVEGEVVCLPLSV